MTFGDVATVIGLLLTLASFVYFAGKITQRVDIHDRDLNNLANEMRARIANLAMKVDELDSRMDRCDVAIAKLED